MKSLQVARYELVTLLRKPGYVILAFGLPLLGVAVLAATTLTGSEQPVEAPQESAADEIELEGYVDLAGIVERLPEDLPPDALVEFASESQAEAALEAGEIASYYVVPVDYLATGELQYIHPTVNPLGPPGQDWVMRRALVYNLVGGEAELLDQIWTPITTESIDLAAAEQQVGGACDRPNANCESNDLVSLMPMMLLVFLFIALTNGSALLMRNISLEKQNRMIEILTSSLSPVQVMAGKIVGLGLATLVAFSVWMGSAAIALRLGDSAQYFPAGFSVPDELVPWAVLFFLLGFGLYASLSAGIGALVPNLKESTGATWLIMAPMLVGYLIGIFAIEQPHSLVMTALSLFPFTAPMVMVQRLSVGGVPLWQPYAAALATAAMLALAIWIASRLFRAQNLLSGQRFSVRRLIGAIAE